MTEELAKQRVLAVYPDAWISGSGFVWEYRSVKKDFPMSEPLGTSWQNAAESLPAAPETEIEIQPGYQRAYKKCQKCGQKATYDFVPYSLSSAVLVCPCSHDFRSEYKTISRDEFYGVAPVEAKEKEPDAANIPCYEVYDAKDIDCTVFQHERMKDLQEFVYQLLDGLEDGESIRIEFKNYTQEELDEVYDEL